MLNPGGGCGIMQLARKEKSKGKEPRAAIRKTEARLVQDRGRVTSPAMTL